MDVAHTVYVVSHANSLSMLTFWSALCAVCQWRTPMFEDRAAAVVMATAHQQAFSAAPVASELEAS